METGHRFVLVVAVDFSEIGDLALDHALHLADREPPAEVHAVHVASAYGPMLRVELGDEARTLPLEEASEELRLHVERHVESLRALGGARFERAVTHIRVGAPPEEVARLAVEVDADLVVMGTHGRRGLRRLLLGSVAEATLRQVHCPVLVVRPKEHELDREKGVAPLAAPEPEAQAT
jgi:nucleotide-binding universal stress UspA family protein